MKLEVSRLMFEKSSIFHFMKIRPLWADLFHMDQHDETCSRFSQRRCDEPVENKKKQ